MSQEQNKTSVFTVALGIIVAVVVLAGAAVGAIAPFGLYFKYGG